MPYISAAPAVRSALKDVAAHLPGDGSGPQLASSAAAHPATIAALNVIVDDQAMLPPISDSRPEVLDAFGRAVGLGGAVAAALLGGGLRYRGEEDGDTPECVPALLARSATYDTHEITDNLVEIGLMGGTRLTREDPAFW